MKNIRWFDRAHYLFVTILILLLPTGSWGQSTITIFATTNSGRVYSGEENTYQAAREKETGGGTTDDIYVGQFFNDPNYIVHRSFITFDLSNVDIDSMIISSITIDAYGQNDYSTDDFTYAAYTSNYETLTTADYNNFEGWETGLTEYTPTLLTDLVNSSTYTSGYGNLLTMTEAGEDSCENHFGGNFQFVYLSTNDIYAITPWDLEILSFSKTNKIKLTISYTSKAEEYVETGGKSYFGYPPGMKIEPGKMNKSYIGRTRKKKK